MKLEDYKKVDKHLSSYFFDTRTIECCCGWAKAISFDPEKYINPYRLFNEHKAEVSQLVKEGALGD